MSYLIGLYVYYHGNNLAMFGFVKGSEEIKNQISIIENTIKLKIKERDKWNSSKYQK